MYTLVLSGEQQYQSYSLWFDPTIAPIHHLPHKTTLIKINNNEKGFIQVKETMQASHQQ
jgi:hypothetical protein